MKNEETFRCNELHMMEETKKTYHSVIGRFVSFRKHSSFSRAFTLMEVMIATALFGLVMAGTFSVYIMCNKIWHSTSISMQTVRESSLALSRLVYGLETNSGLRAASMILLQTNNVYGHPYPFLATNKYWETGAKPPSATDEAHYTHVGCGYGTDGSWRLIISNGFDGIQCVDYNSKMRNILFCPDTNQTSAARQKRILICNYVSAARVTTNASGTVTIQVTVSKQDGMLTSSNTVTTTVKMRNKP